MIYHDHPNYISSTRAPIKKRPELSEAWPQLLVFPGKEWQPWKLCGPFGVRRASVNLPWESFNLF